MQEQCSELHVPYFIILKESEPGVVRLRSWDGDRFHEEKINSSDFITKFLNRLRPRNENSNSDQNSNSNSFNKTDSKTNYIEKCEHNHENTTANILFVTDDDEKLSANTRKRYENQVKSFVYYKNKFLNINLNFQIRSQLDDFLKRLNGEVIVVAVNIDSYLIRKLCGFLDFQSEKQFNSSVETALER